MGEAFIAIGSGMEWARRFILRLLPEQGSTAAQVKKAILPSYGVYELQGQRPYMEDTHICVPCLSSHLESETIPKDVRLFAVFDGHGGKFTSTYASHHFPSILAEQIAATKTLEQQEEVSEMLANTLKETHARLLRDHPDKEPMDGCTAVVCLEYQGSLWTANLGDSRAVLCREGRAVALTDDHSPIRPDEYNRIHNAGGFVRKQSFYDCPRIYWADTGGGGLALSRALGDEYYCRDGIDLVPADPEVTFEKIDERDQFVLLFTDGLLEPFSSDEIVAQAEKLSRGSHTPRQIAQYLVNSALEAGSMDNLTCVYWDLHPKE